MTNPDQQAIDNRRQNTVRVLALGRAEGWTDEDLGGLLGHFHPALIVRFDRDDCYLADGRLVGRHGHPPYDREAWEAYLANLPK